MTLEHQRQTVESMIQQERTRASEQLHEMEAKVRDMQELVFSKMREASEERELHIPLKAEIEAMKMLLEEEEKRWVCKSRFDWSSYENHESNF